MDFPVKELSTFDSLSLLREIPEPPKKVYVRGELPNSNLKLLAVVGSRKYSTYGKEVIQYLIDGLRDYPVGIVSGLALGVDSLAHKAALENNLYTLAVPGSGIDDRVIYPATHRSLAREILRAGGGLLSEFEPTMKAAKWTFPARNRIMAGLTHATLLIEAAEQSGTLITARLAVDYNRELLVVPGNIFSKNSRGVHQFLKLGATPVTEPQDILEALGIDMKINLQKPPNSNVSSSFSAEERKLLDILIEPMDIDTLMRLSGLSASSINVLLMEMEMKGLIANQSGRYRAII